MTRLIDAEDIAFAIEENSIEMNGEQVIEVSCAKALIDFAQTFEERPHGKWIKKVDDVGFVSYICNKCGFELELEDCSDSYYCTICGAKMKEAENEC